MQEKAKAEAFSVGQIVVVERRRFSSKQYVFLKVKRVMRAFVELSDGSKWKPEPGWRGVNHEPHPRPTGYGAHGEEMRRPSKDDYEAARRSATETTFENISKALMTALVGYQNGSSEELKTVCSEELRLMLGVLEVGSDRPDSLSAPHIKNWRKVVNQINEAENLCNPSPEKV
jgi:hypothetical protein